MAPRNTWAEIAAVTCRSEGDVETRVLAPLLAALGWPRDEVHAKVPVSFRMGGKKGRPFEADFVTAPASEAPPIRAWVVLEAKKPSVGLVKSQDQAWSYAYALRAAFFCVTDGVDFEVWQTGICVENRLVLALPICELAQRHGELEFILRREAILHYYTQHKLPSHGLTAVDISSYVIEIKGDLTDNVAVPRTLANATEAAVVISTAVSALTLDDSYLYQILGAGGRGKTSLLRVLALNALNMLTATTEITSAPGRVPISVRATDASGDILTAAARQFIGIPALASRAAFCEWLSRTSSLIIIDDWHRLEASHLETAEQSALRAFG